MSNRHLSEKNALSGKLILNAILVVLLICLLQVSAQAATSVDRIVALVNDDIITLSELKARIDTMRKMQRGLPSGPALERQVLDSMIELELLNQMARKVGIAVGDQEIDGVIERIKNENNITEAQLKGSLKQSGISYSDYRNNLKNELLKEKFLYLNIYQKIVVTEAEVDKFLAGEGPSTRGLYLGGSAESDKVRFLFLASSPNRSAQILQKAASIKQEVEAGLSFAEAAKLYSQGPGASAGGDTGTTIGELAPQLKAVAMSMAPGQTSEPLDGGQAVLLLYVEPRGASPTPTAPTSENGSKPDMGSFSPEQRNMARRQLEQIKAQKKYETWLSEIKAKANIKITL
jgi:peptidyl-prolyl cis-trans isomerase SurA